MSCTQAELAVVVMTLEPFLVPFPEESIAEDMVSFRKSRNLLEIDLFSQPLASTSEVRTCDQCYCHGVVCEWPGPKERSRSCTFCKTRKSVCVILGKLVSNRKPWRKLDKAWGKKRKWDEVESEAEYGLEESGED